MPAFNPKIILVYATGDKNNAYGEHLIRLPFLHALRQLWPSAWLCWGAAGSSLLPFLRQRFRLWLTD